MKKILRIVAMVLGGALLVLQFFRIDKSNPPADQAQDYLAISAPPAEISTLIKAACYDCHSHTTQYPWYSNIQPVAWWVKDHIEEGREHLNFSVWATYNTKKAAHKLEECYEVIESKEMPMKSYTWMHGSARLSAEERSTLAAWFRQQYQQYEKSEKGPAKDGEHEVEHEGGAS